MPVTIDITKDLRYRQGVEEGVENKMKIVAENLLKEGLAVLFVQKMTGLPLAKIEEIAWSLETGKEITPFLLIPGIIDMYKDCYYRTGCEGGIEEAGREKGRRPG